MSIRDILFVAQKEHLFFCVEKKPLRYKRVQSLHDVRKNTFYVASSDAEHTQTQQAETRLKGTKETSDIVFPGNIVIGGPSAERYVIRTPKFFDLYNVVDNVAIARTGLVRKAIRITRPLLAASGVKGNKIEFIAPWGEPMIAEAGDVLIVQGKDSAYRIEGKTFDATYRIAKRLVHPSCDTT